MAQEAIRGVKDVAMSTLPLEIASWASQVAGAEDSPRLVRRSPQQGPALTRALTRACGFSRSLVALQRAQAR